MNASSGRDVSLSRRRKKGIRPSAVKNAIVLVKLEKYAV
jgi:hypothetical protein